jgi:tRNA-Thr(GGU) m(6)t(6)A37 methyltransferase TsaA
MQSLVLDPIGIVKSCFRDKFGTPRQPGLVPMAEAIIEILPKFQPEFSLQGLEQFSHLWVIFHFHQNTNKKFNAKVHPPRLGGETVGLFASRTPHRPNPIGLSLVEIVSVEKNSVVVRSHDLVDGTPVLDIKPYIKEIESQPNAKSGWCETVVPTEIQVQWTDAALSGLQQTSRNQGELKKLVEETLRLDPRPVVYRGYEGEDAKYRDVHAVRLHDIDAHFVFRSPQLVEVVEVRSTVSPKI